MIPLQKNETLEKDKQENKKLKQKPKLNTKAIQIAIERMQKARQVFCIL